MKSTRIIFWSTTILIFLLEGVMPALTSQTELAKEGLRHLGYPEYFGIMLTVFKVLGALVLIIPKFSGRIKEWAFVGFGFNFISACISHWAVDGFGAQVIFPIIAFAILIVSYVSYHKLNSVSYKTA